jgi:uncharacterized protein (TIGR00251 family)
VADETRLTVKVIPGASRSELAGFSEGVLRVRVAAAPEKGKANRELTDYLAGMLGVRKSAVTVVRGTTARTKTVAIAGLGPDEVAAKLGIKQEGA